MLGIASRELKVNFINLKIPETMSVKKKCCPHNGLLWIFRDGR